MKITRLLFSFIFVSTVAFGQTRETTMAALINHMYKSDSSTFIFDLNAVPKEVTNRIMHENDSITHALFKEKETLTLKRFMANTYQKWNSPDGPPNEHLPYRRFVYAITQGSKWILVYEHGGFGSHYHIVYFDINDHNSITSSETLLNGKQIDELVSNQKIAEIQKKPFEKIVDENEFRLVSGHLLHHHDVF